MQCKDVPREPILIFLLAFRGQWATWFEDSYPMPSVLDAMPAGTPPKLALAKMRMLIRSGHVAGCACGCRGDFRITEKGVAAIAP